MSAGRLRRAQSPRRTNASPAAMPRTLAIKWPTARSATADAFEPTLFATATPRARAASRSTPS
jgi:hypothetical protein